MRLALSLKADSTDQQQFACLVPAIWIGAACERARVIPMLIFTFCHVTLVYCPLVAMIWNPNGWAYQLGILDYAGGCVRVFSDVL